MTPKPDLPEIRKVLLKFPHFRGGSFEALDSAAACFRLRDVAAGEVVLSRGAPGDALFFVMTGIFEAHIAPNKVAVMEVGDFFGEIGLLLGVERTTSVVAREPGRLLVLPGEHLGRIMKVFPQLRRSLEEKAQRRAPELMPRLDDVTSL